jgi:hypothetical protein
MLTADASPRIVEGDHNNALAPDIHIGMGFLWDYNGFFPLLVV